MNCKPGDLAYIVVPHPHFPDFLGRIVEVKAWIPGFNEWLVEFVGAFPESAPKDATYSAPDYALRPIAGPSTDHLVHTEILNPLELALGITAKAWL